MAKSFVNEVWHRMQKQRWDALRGYGWQFSGPSHARDDVSIKMSRNGETAAFSVPRSLPPQEIHTRLLRYCEDFAAIADANGDCEE